MLFRRPLHEIARWPAWELDLLEEFLVREPAELERIEIMLARLTAFYVNAHQKEGVAEKNTDDFLPFLKAWPSAGDGRYSDVDLEVLRELK